MGDGVPTDQLSHNHCDCTDSHCRSHIVASCVFVPLVPTATTRRRRRVPSTMSTSPSSSRRASVVSSCQDTSRKVTLPGRAAEDSCGQLRATCTSTHRRPDSACVVLRHRGSTQSKCGLSLSMRCCVPFCPMPYHKSIGRATSAMRWTASRATPSSSRATTMAAASEVCLVVISQDTSLETVLWIYLSLRTLSWCKVSPQLLDGNDSGDCVKSSSDASVRTIFDPFFASVTSLAVLFPVMSTHRTTHGH